ncbi:MAG: GNAT family N-acetyltransferase [Nitrospirota bacterium]
MIPKIEKLGQGHDFQAFDCGNSDLNTFIQKNALSSQNSGGSTTFVGLADQTVIGYYSLAVGSVQYEQAPDRLKKGLGQYDIPIMLLARLAVDCHWQNNGVGAGLLKNSMLRTLQVAKNAGIRALIVHAKDKGARGFYEHFNFFPSPTDPLHLFILLKNVRQIVQYPTQS